MYCETCNGYRRPAHLILRSCEWPLELAKYKKLGALIPTSYTVWELDRGASLGVVRSLCEGANKSRARLVGKAPLVVYSDQDEDFKGVDTGKHVVVQRKPSPSGW